MMFGYEHLQKPGTAWFQRWGQDTHWETGRTDCKYRNMLDVIKSQLNVVFANEKLKSPMTELLWLCVHPCSIEGVLITDNTGTIYGTRTNVVRGYSWTIIHINIFECTQLHKFMQRFGPMCATNGTKNYHRFVCLPFNFNSCTPTKNDWATVSGNFTVTIIEHSRNIDFPLWLAHTGKIEHCFTKACS